MARKLVIFLVVLAVALLTYAPVGLPSMAMGAGGMAAMADCPISMDDIAAGSDGGAGTNCAIDGRCLAGCVFSNGIPSFHLAAAPFAFAPSAASSVAWTDQDPLAATSGLPPFRPPRHSPQA